MSKASESESSSYGGIRYQIRRVCRSSSKIGSGSRSTVKSSHLASGSSRPRRSTAPISKTKAKRRKLNRRYYSLRSLTSSWLPPRRRKWKSYFPISSVRSKRKRLRSKQTLATIRQIGSKPTRSLSRPSSRALHPPSSSTASIV